MDFELTKFRPLTASAKDYAPTRKSKDFSNIMRPTFIEITKIDTGTEPTTTELYKKTPE